MAAPLISSQFRIHNAQQFYEAFGEAAPTNMYFFIGRPQAWDTTTISGVTAQHSASYNSSPTDNNPPTPIDNFNYEQEMFEDMIAMKKIPAANAALVIQRYTWTAGVTYSMYRHNYTADYKANSAGENASNLYDAQFYVINTANYAVYKCIYNGSSPTYPNGIPSTVAPTGTSSSISTTADGYKWKYMYTLGTDDVLKFLTSSYMPVNIESAIVTNAALNVGKIDTIVIKNAGSGYNDGTYTGVPIRGDGTGGTVTLTVVAGAVTGVAITNGGSNYTFARINVNNNEISGVGSGSGANLEIIIPPSGGHGANAYKELGTKRVMVNVKLEYSESGEFPITNDFRRIGLIRDPLQADGSAATLNTYTTLKSIKFPSGTSSDFLVDEIITQSGTNAVGRVVDWDSSTKVLKYYQSEYEDVSTGTSGGAFNLFSGANTVTGSTSSSAVTPDLTYSGTSNNVTFVSGYAGSEIKSYSGDIIYIENRRPISRASDQVEDVKLVVEF
jgi:hypothetical protein